MTGPTVSLPSSLKIDAVDALYDALNQVRNTEEEVLLDGTNCESIDYCGLQLLLAFAAERRAQSRGVSLQSSPVLDAAFADLAVADTFSA